MDERAPELTERLRAALAAKGKEYRARTHHLQTDGSPQYVNRLILETSPYLLQHAHNPVDWFPWGAEAFEKARREDKPVLMSVGYSTCHWCHVMERESFEDQEIASFLNQHFVAIKVDREERPDVDDIYMSAVQLMTGRGGWPMTVVMTPEKQPFFCGTYLPARDGDRGARFGFLTLLRELARAYAERRDEVVAQAREVSQRLAAGAQPRPPGEVPGESAIRRGVDDAKSLFDRRFGGFGRAPKFPRPSLPELLLRYQHRSGDQEALEMATLTLERMAAGGMYDHVGGGFHRYSTDARWLVPHFEKMLYDNAQLVGVYLDAYQATGEARFADVARDTLRYVRREMTAPEGGFYSATDADSPTPSGHDEEGYFFTWTPAELEEVLGPERARVAEAYYALTAEGNFEGRNILSTPRSAEVVARELGMGEAELRGQLASVRDDLYAARSRRPPPLRDDKLLTSWNGLMISAFARAALVLGEPELAGHAQRAAEFVLARLATPDGALLRSFKDGKAQQPAFLDDYAFLVQGLLDLFEASAEPRWLEQALRLQAFLDRHFWGEGGGYFMTSDTHEALLTRDKPSYDGAEPSGNSVALMNLLRLNTITEAAAFRQRAEQAFAAFSTELVRAPHASPKLLSALDCYLDRSLEVFIVAPPDGAGAEPLLERFRRCYLPNRAFAFVQEGAAAERLAQLVPGLAGKAALEGRATAYVCEQGACQLPTSDPEIFARQLSDRPAQFRFG